MKKIGLMALLMSLCAAAAQSATLIDFNNTSDLTNNFVNANPLYTNVASGGLANSGCVSIPSSYVTNIWTTKGSIPLVVGTTNVVSAYFYNFADAGYGSLGFAVGRTNSGTLGGMATPSSAMGMSFHAGGGAFQFNTASATNRYTLNWAGGELSNQWYKFTYSLVYRGGSVFDATFLIQTADSNGNILGTHSFTNHAGMTNGTVSATNILYVYFGNDGQRMSAMDDFSSDAHIPLPAIDFNNTSDLTNNFSSANPLYTNVASGGLANSGCVSITNANVTDIWTTKGQISLVAGVTNVVSAYFYNFSNNGYGSLGFAVGRTNSAPLLQKATPYSALGMSFHSGGGEFEDNTASVKNPYTVTNWTGGSLALSQWYKFTYSLVYRGGNVFDATFLIQTADTNGTILGTKTFESHAGMTNGTVGATNILYVYFGNDGIRMSAMDDFSSDAQVPLGGGIALATNALLFNATYQGGNPAAQMVGITNVGGSGFTFTNVLTYGAGAMGWLTVTRNSGGVALGGATALTNLATVSGVNVGTHSATVTVASADATNSPRQYAVTLTVDKASQSITFPAISAQVVTNRVGLSATAGSGLAVSFAVGSGLADIAGGTNLTFSGTGLVSIVASQAGNTNFNAAPNMTNTFSVSKATALVTLTNLIQTYDGTARVVGYTSDPSVSSVLLTYNGSAWAPTNAGSYAVTGTVNDTVYQGSAVNTLLVGQASQSITFPAIGRKLVSASVGLTATASSSLTVTFAAFGPGTISNASNLTFSGAGDVSVVASQSGNSNYHPASSVTNLIHVYNLLPDAGPYAGGNMITITNGGFGTVTNVLVDGVLAAIQSSGANWVTFMIPAGLTPGAKDIVIQTSDQGDTTLSNAYTVNPAGAISDYMPSWTEIIGLSTARYGAAVAELSNNLYVIGGAMGSWFSAVAKTNVYRFDGTNWTEVAGLPANRYLAGAAAYSGQVYAVGGYNTSIERTNVYRFDGASWTEIVGLPTSIGRVAPAVCVWSNHLYSIGGSTNMGGCYGSTNVFRFNGTDWEEVKGMPTPSYGMVAGVLNGLLYVAGGYNQAYQTHCYRYDGVNWIEMSGLPEGLVFAGGAVLSDHLYAIGGESSGAGIRAQVYRFNGTAWTLDSSLPAARDNIGAGVMNGTLFAIGGRDSGEIAATNVYRYNPEAFGVSPSNGLYTGGYPVVITGSNLCDGSDVTNVTLCGVNVSGITGQSATQIVVTAGVAGGAVTGDVRVFSTSFGETVKSNAFAYLAPELAVLGTNGAVVASGNTASWTDGTKFRPTLLGTARTNTFSITNNGDTALNISGYTTNGTDKSLFAADDVPTVVDVGGVSNFTVVYTPASFGSHSASVEFTSDDLASPFTLNLGGSCFGVSTNIGPYAGGNTITVTNGNFGTVTNVLVGGVAASIQSSGANWVTITIPAIGSAGVKDIVIQTSDQGDTTLSNAYTVNPAGVGSDVSPTSGSWTGGYPVVITGTNLGNGSDITNVTLCGVTASILPGQSATQVVVVAGAGGPGLGDVRIYSISFGETVKSNAFTYTASGISVSGSPFDHVIVGWAATNIFTVTNAGSLTLTISAWTNDGIGAEDFELIDPPASVSPGTASNFPIVFHPSVVRTVNPTCYTVNNSLTPNYSFGLYGQASHLSTNIGPSAGGNTITITNGTFGTITNVLVGGVAAAIQSSGADWVTFTIPAGLTPGAKDIVIQTSDNGDTTLVGAYTINPAGEISGFVDWLRWQEMEGLPAARYYHSAAVLNDGLYAVGGRDDTGVTITNVYRYNGTNWMEVAGLPDVRERLSAEVLNGELYAVGGIDDTWAVSTNAYRYNGTNWTETAGLPAAREDLAAGVLNGALYTVGGYNVAAKTNVYRYNGTNWTEMAGLPASRRALAAGVLNGELYAVGGLDVSSAAKTNVYRYNGTNWTEMAGLPSARYGLAVGVLDGTLYAIGGLNSANMQSTNVYRYNGTNWTETAGLPGARDSHAAGVLNGELYAVGGLDTNSATMTNVFRYPFLAQAVTPAYGSHTGGYQVIIVGVNLGDGGDVTNVTLCGVNASVGSQSATQIVVTAGVAFSASLGDVHVYSVSFGETVKSNAFTYEGPTAKLTIQSSHGIGTPAVGIYTNLIGSVLTNLITSSDPQGTTQYICSGWAMTGNEPASGTTNQCVMTLTNDATLTWLWTTNYWLETVSGLHGSVNVGNGWQALGVTTSITATAAQYYHFTNWSGDAIGNANPLNLLMDAPKLVTAHFAQNMTTSSPVPVPEEWLAQYGLTNFEDDANADPDDDGQKTWEEYLAAETNPTNPLSYFRAQVGEGIMLISWPSASGRVYDVEATLNVPGYDWTPTEWINQVATPPMNTVTNPTSAMTNAAQFFRVNARME